MVLSETVVRNTPDVVDNAGRESFTFLPGRSNVLLGRFLFSIDGLNICSDDLRFSYLTNNQNDSLEH